MREHTDTRDEDLWYSHCGSDFIFASILCKIIDVMTLFSKVE